MPAPSSCVSRRNLKHAARLVAPRDCQVEGVTAKLKMDVKTKPPTVSRPLADSAVPSPARFAELERKTRETSVAVALHLDGSGRSEIRTGVPFLDHMLESFARHGFFDLKVEATGDLHIDDYHTAEDVGVVMGRA